MPCADYRDDDIVNHEIRLKASIKAAFCALATVLENSGQLDAVLNNVDWVEAGITAEQFRTLWAEHKHNDKVRREEEAAKRIELEKIKAAKAKLTLEERKLLNIMD